MVELYYGATIGSNPTSLQALEAPLLDGFRKAVGAHSSQQHGRKGGGPIRGPAGLAAAFASSVAGRRIVVDPKVGLGRIVALHYCSSVLYKIR